jgi:hypothetical protein
MYKQIIVSYISFDFCFEIWILYLHLKFGFEYAPDEFLGACCLSGSKSASVNFGITMSLFVGNCCCLPIIFYRFRSS